MSSDGKWSPVKGHNGFEFITNYDVNVDAVAVRVRYYAVQHVRMPIQAADLEEAVLDCVAMIRKDLS